MKTTLLRTLLALVALAAVTSFATADQSDIGSLFGECSGDASEITPNLGVEPATYVHGDVMEALPAAEADSDDEDTSSDHKSCHSSCSCGECCGGCECGSCVGGCSCDGCAGDCGSCVGGCDGCAYGPCGSCESYCGDACCGCGCGPYGCDGCCGDCSNYDMNAGMYYVEIQNIFMRTHFSSDVVGKLREKYEWSPRIVGGYESPGGLGGRMRWWSYSRTNSTVDGDEALHFDLDVLDAEGTARFSSRRADLLIAGGLRYANFEIAQDDDEIASDLPGITFAGDGRMAICCMGRSQWSAVCGARWSLLFGDWEGDDTDLVEPEFDDNVTTHEIYGGVEYLCHDCNYDLFARIVFEVQNWHSDVLGETSATDSIGFIGPAIHGGISF
jgi:hypothetical protein